MMSESAWGRRRLFWVGGALVFALSVFAMAWMWAGGGISLNFGPAPAAVEECDVGIEGAPLLAGRLAPRMVEAFLRSSGYTIQSPQPSRNGALRVVGARAGVTCTVTIAATSSTQGLRALETGRAAIALSLRPLTDRDAPRLAAAGAGDFVAERAAAEHVIALDAVAAVVNERNPIQTMTIDELVSVVFGFAPRWETLDLGRDAPPTMPDGAVTLYMPRDGNTPDDFPNDLVTARFPQYEALLVRATRYGEDEGALTALQNDAGGVTVVSAAILQQNAGVRVLRLGNGAAASLPTAEATRNRTYPLIRRLFFYVRPDQMQTSAFVQRFVAFSTSADAATIVQEAGFHSPRREEEAMGEVVGRCVLGTPEAAAVAAATRGATLLAPSLRFLANSTRLDDASMRHVDEVVSNVRDRLGAGAVLVAIGHADTDGNEVENRAVALRRALAVRQAFEARGLFGVVVESAGERCPSNDTMTEEGRRASQRVDLWLRAAPVAR